MGGKPERKLTPNKEAPAEIRGLNPFVTVSNNQNHFSSSHHPPRLEAASIETIAALWS